MRAHQNWEYIKRVPIVCLNARFPWSAQHRTRAHQSWEYIKKVPIVCLSARFPWFKVAVLAAARRVPFHIRRGPDWGEPRENAT